MCVCVRGRLRCPSKSVQKKRPKTDRRLPRLGWGGGGEARQQGEEETVGSF